MKTFLLSLVFLFTAFYIRSAAFAIYDPLSVPNNPYGVHIVEFNDLPELPGVVNSNGGDWGYVTVVVSERDFDTGKIQKVFDQMRQKHLIPLVRLATKPIGDVWKKPDPSGFDSIVSFLAALHWPVENRYVILYNEPNHANEWGGEIDPEGYAQVVVELGKKLKKASSDFYILPAGLDVSAASDGKSLSSPEYLRRMIHSQPEFLHTIDGWTSHSYPNPGFSGSPYARGRGTLTSFDWELTLLESMGLSKQLPVFITETGWMHAEGKFTRYGAYSADTVGDNITVASLGAWKDTRIAAITPFVYNYQDVPFDSFSWKTLGNTGQYSFVNQYKDIPKVAGRPQQRESYWLTKPLIPNTLVVNSSYTLSTELKNIGQGIIDESSGYGLYLESNDPSFGFLSDPLPYIEPFKSDTISMHLKTPHQSGSYPVVLYITHDSIKIPLQTITVLVVPPPSVTIKATLGWVSEKTARDVKALVYDGNTLIHESKGLTLENGEVTVPNIKGIIVGRPYRVVVVVPSYLPRQKIIPLQSTNTVVQMKRLLPFDLDKDGALSLKDLYVLLHLQPFSVIKLFVSF